MKDLPTIAIYILSLAVGLVIFFKGFWGVRNQNLWSGSLDGNGSEQIKGKKAVLWGWIYICSGVFVALLPFLIAALGNEVARLSSEQGSFLAWASDVVANGWLVWILILSGLIGWIFKVFSRQQKNNK